MFCHLAIVFEKTAITKGNKSVNTPKSRYRPYLARPPPRPPVHRDANRVSTLLANQLLMFGDWQTQSGSHSADELV